ncbi:MAG: cell division protein FtsB [Gammaproteobacteria bacterium]|nr:cell division protein FtsB [Gammaproteobacteria bacterium]
MIFQENNVFKTLTVILILILLLLQYQLWAGYASFGRQAELVQRVEVQRLENQRNIARNKILFAEIADLKNGSEAIEERARHELGMIREGEVFYRVINN